MRPNYLLRAVLAIVGAVIVFLGLNVGFGGIETLGWQGGAVPFVTVTDPAVFAVRDSHIRFIGGVWLALGLVMLAGSVAFERLRTVLIALTTMVVVGGLARFSGDMSILLSAGRSYPFFAPTRYLLGGGAQARIAQRHGEAGQVEGLA